MACIGVCMPWHVHTSVQALIYMEKADGYAVFDGGDCLCSKPAGTVGRAPLRQVPLAVKGLAVIFALCVAVRLLGSAGGDIAGGGSGRIVGGSVAEAILRFELWPAAETGGTVPLTSVILGPAGTPGVSPSAAAVPSPSAAAPTVFRGVSGRSGHRRCQHSDRHRPGAVL